MSLSGKGRRNKGLVGEREVTRAFRAAGCEVKNLDGGGDHLVVRDQDGLRDLHLEVKRQEKLHLDEWSKQAEDEAPRGSVPVVVYRRSGQPWRISMLLADYLEDLR